MVRGASIAFGLAGPDAGTTEVTNMRKPPEAAGGDARIRILLAAEQNIALVGVDEATNRKILSDAGKRNASAVQYHFGTREELINAILSFRIPQVEAERARIYHEMMERKGAAV